MIEKEDLNEDLESESHTDDSLIPISGMYKDWFIDYASYAVSYTHLTLPTTYHV